MKLKEMNSLSSTAYSGDFNSLYSALSRVNFVPKTELYAEQRQELSNAYAKASQLGLLKSMPGGSNYQWFVHDTSKVKLIGVVDPMQKKVIGMSIQRRSVVNQCLAVQILFFCQHHERVTSLLLATSMSR